MKTLRVGVIGSGYWGPKLARNFNNLPGSQLAWVSDLREERLAHIRNLYPAVKTTGNYRELLDSDIDAVAIATPVSTHHGLALEALRAGEPTFNVVAEFMMSPISLCIFRMASWRMSASAG